MRRLYVSLLLLPMLGCGSVTPATIRLIKDLTVVGTSPIQIPCAATKDALTYDEDDSVNVCFAPALIPVMAGKHMFFTALYGADICLYPLYLPMGPQPLDLYDLSEFPYKTRGEKHRWIYEELFLSVNEGG